MSFPGGAVVGEIVCSSRIFGKIPSSCTWVFTKFHCKWVWMLVKWIGLLKDTTNRLWSISFGRLDKPTTSYFFWRTRWTNDEAFLLKDMINQVKKGHSCKTGNVRYGGTSKTQNWKGWLAIAKLKPLSLSISPLSMPKKGFDNVKIEKWKVKVVSALQ